MSDFVQEGSVITEKMVAGYAEYFGQKLNDESRPGFVGSLLMLEQGQGEWPEKLLSQIYAPLHAAYDAAKGVVAPEAGAEVKDGQTSEEEHAANVEEGTEVSEEVGQVAATDVADGSTGDQG